MYWTTFPTSNTQLLILHSFYKTFQDVIQVKNLPFSSGGPHLPDSADNSSEKYEQKTRLARKRRKQGQGAEGEEEKAR
jgi:hypothetical protein